ncbi:MAG: class II aldolase/adducin family protein [Hyphomicrobiaceae bacterium]
MDKAERAIRQAIIEACRAMNTSGLNQGTSGNISVRHGERLLITPSATSYERMTPEMIAAMPLADPSGRFEGPLKPSTEWHFHVAIARTRPEIGAIVHTHSTFATVLAMARRDIPACHYMVAAFGGNDVRCARYATFGTEALARNVLAALEGRSACLMANHGMIATGADLEKAMWAAVELETLARQYWHALALGGAVILSDEEMAEVRGRFGSYGIAAGTPRATPGRGPDDPPQASSVTTPRPRRVRSVRGSRA